MQTPFFTDADIDSLVQQFDNQSLPAEDWTHEAHLAVAGWYLKHYDFYDACCRIKSGIFSLNNAHGTPNHAGRGYHETLTWFWMTVMSCWAEQSKHQTPAAMVNAFLEHIPNNRLLVAGFYEPADIMAPDYRAFRVMPVKQELNWTTLQAVILAIGGRL